MVAAAGAVCLAGGAVAAHGAGYRFVVVTTGSMHPAVPAGSLVIASPSEGGRVDVGDVLVMTRPDGLRVTHRVVSVDDGAGGLSAVTKGDANPAPDVTPYPLDGTVLRVSAAIPSVGGLLARVGTGTGRLVAIALATSAVAGIALREIWAADHGPPLASSGATIL